ncbi:MAG TPA: M20/M25/M40 family metallo-hydrolase [Pyrinomonadaceae bacterium]|nr:M20/M25/M40 family metallo-hydrolase [Pyrinomonadaceae bacterium]
MFQISKLTLIFLIVALSFIAVSAQVTTDAESLANSPNVKTALDYIKSIEPNTIEEQIKITEIASPTFKEQKRAEYFKQRFTELGLKNVRIDKVGNVIGERMGTGGANAPNLVLAAHLDTVFDNPEVKVSCNGNIIKGLGISDDGRGLTVLLAIAQTLEKQKIKTQGNIIFVANVGEEGLGDLYGTRHLFNEELKGKITHFISIDGSGLTVTTAAVGSFRYRVTFTGAGGHSYGAFGLPNPIHAIGRLIEKVSRFQVPEKPKTTFNVGKIEGGTSVNSIARTATLEMDMRSESAEELAKLDGEFKKAAQVSLEEENARWTNPRKLTVEIKPIGNRPTGSQSPNSPIIKLAASADKVFKIKSEFTATSTDSNIPISLGIPAITIDGGGKGSGEHSIDEQFDSTDSHLGSQRGLLIVLGVVGVAEDKKLTSFNFKSPGNPDVKVFYSAPPKLSPKTKVLIVMAGRQRDADNYIESWIEWSKKNDYLVLAPLFDEKNWVEPLGYNFGNIATGKEKDNTPNPKSKWAFTLIEQMFDYARNEFKLNATKYDLFGHSAGGQFVHRFMLFMPESRTRIAIAANPGFYTLPDLNEDFPYGLKNSPYPLTNKDLLNWTNRKLILMRGTADVERTESLRQTPEADAQGKNRFERAGFMFNKIKTLNPKTTWQMFEVQGVAHDQKGMALAAQKVLENELK